GSCVARKTSPSAWYQVAVPVFCIVTTTVAGLSNATKLGAVCETNAAEYSTWARQTVLIAQAANAASAAISKRARRPASGIMGRLGLMCWGIAVIAMDASGRWRLERSCRASFNVGRKEAALDHAGGMVGADRGGAANGARSGVGAPVRGRFRAAGHGFRVARSRACH